MKKAMSALAIVLLGALNVCGVEATVEVAPFNSAAIESLTLKLPESTTPATYKTAQQIRFTSRSSFTITLKVKTGYRNDAHMTVTENQSGLPMSTTTVNSGAQVTPRYPGVVISDLTATLITNKVSLSAEGGTLGSSYVMMPYGTEYGTKLPTATRTGYTFDGWYTAKTGGTKVESTTVEQETADHTLYAHWTANTYTVTFNPNGGTVTPTTQSVTYDQNYGTLPTPAKTGYDFVSWTNRAGSVVSSTTTCKLEADETLYASWSAQQYTIRYHENFGVDETWESKFSYGSNIALDGAVGRKGYEFDGWDESPNAVNATYAANQRVGTATLAYVDKVANLYAIWKAKKYTVTLNANGGVGTDQVKDRLYDDGVALVSDPVFARTGYILKGWGTRPTDKEPSFADGTTENLSEQSLTLYALWEPISYVVAFDKGDDRATGEMDEMALVYDVVTNLSPCAFVKDGYEFQGWTTNGVADVAFAEGATISNLTAMANDRVTLTAKWKAESYELVLDAAGGEFEATGQTTTNILVTVDETYGLFPAVTNRTPKQVFSSWGYWTNGVWTSVSATDRVPPRSAGITTLAATWVKDDPIARALDAEALDFSASPEWTVVTDPEAVGGTCVAATTDREGLVDLPLELTVVGPGVLSFRWKVASEDAAYYDSLREVDEKLEFFASEAGSFKYALWSTPSRWGHAENGNSEELGDAIEGTIGWTNMSYVVEAAEGVTNTVRWVFSVQKIDQEVIGHAYLDNIVWTPGSARQETATHRVPYSWLKANFTGAATMTDSELETLAESASPNGKCWPDGTPVHVWEDYAAGTDPQDKTDVFKALITVEEGVPSVSWTPDLGAERTYRIFGATSLEGPWAEDVDPASGDFRFFKVQIVYP